MRNDPFFKWQLSKLKHMKDDNERIYWIENHAKLYRRRYMVLQFFKKIWEFLSGKKRNIALVFWTFIVPLSQVYTLPDNMMKLLTAIGIALSALGVSHSLVKDVKQDGDVG
jgi:hypothetical protein